MTTQLRLILPLPATFRPGDVLSFHRRDRQEIAERVTDDALHKGIMWQHAPACLTVTFGPGQAEVRLSVDGRLPDISQTALESMVRRMLGLTQDIDAFETRHRDHPQLGLLITHHPGLRVPATATPFEALTWAVAGQQISLGAAVALRRKLIEATNIRHSSGLLCYPGARQIAGLSEVTLRQAGFSATKTRTLLTLSAQVMEDRLPLDTWASTLPIDEMRAQLLAIKGIGPWTVNYTLLRGFGWLDGSLHGDAAVQRGVQTLLHAPDRISAQAVQDWLAQFSPWRALAAAHIWAMRTDVAY